MERGTLSLLYSGTTLFKATQGSSYKAGSVAQTRPDQALCSSEDGGSLPESPQTEDFIPDFPCPGALQEDTRRLMAEFYRGKTVPGRAPHPALGTMEKVVGDLVLKHRLAYNGMVQRVSLEDNRMEVISRVAKLMFEDGTMNWGRVVSLVAFGEVVCEKLRESGQDECVEYVVDHISTYLSTYQHQWLINNKGWDGFVEFFRKDDPESQVWNTLVKLVGVAGLGAGLALLMR
ncbi:induced myeloid leukemia cell differentiation protein Mcl-1a [Hoplias malabaricus]|uniref:induced myeloid leukemia cell differentiation protein Mcl-1a n=1 Tax=Hoplias malabaricus TaxID=27720 RepID=UPI00346266DE